jgi:hypothetical protein
MVRRLTKILPILVLASLLSAGGAKAARPFEIGMEDDDVLAKGYWGDPAATLDFAKQLRTSWMRIQLRWSDTLPPRQATARKRPTRLRYNWSPIDGEIAGAALRGMRVQIAFTGPAPAWATSNHHREPSTSWRPNAKAYGQWVGAAVRHFRPRGVRRYSIWNEPNHAGYLQPLKEAPTLYRKLWFAGLKAVRKADGRRGTQVLFGETAPWRKRRQSWGTTDFMRAVLCVNGTYTRRDRRCPKVVADGYASHPYDGFYSPFERRPGAENVTVSTLDRLTRALDKLARLGALRRRGGGKMPIYLTEFGYFTKRRGVHTRSYPEKVRRRYTVKAYDIALRNPRVRELVWYQLIEPARWSARGWISYLVHLNGVPTGTFFGLRAWANRNASKLAR